MHLYPWPETCAGSHATKELAHAIGVICINWAWCEFALEAILDSYLQIPGRLSARLVTPLGNLAKTNLLRAIAEEEEPNPKKREHLRYFASHYDTCRENRNLIVHGLCVDEIDYTEGPALTQFKAGLQLTERAVPLDTDIILGVCHEVSELFDYGLRIFDFGKEDAELPHGTSLQRPLPPRKLTQILPAHIVERLPPRSSRA